MIQELNVNNFDQEINKDKPVVVEFYTTACSHCKKLAGALNKLSEEKGDDVFFGKCNIDQETGIEKKQITGGKRIWVIQLYFQQGF